MTDAPDPEPETRWTPLVFVQQVLRYPVLIGGALVSWFEALDPGAAPATKVAVVATVTLLQSALSVSRKAATEQAAGSAYVGALEHQATAQAAAIIEARAAKATGAAPPAPAPPPQPAAA